ncbi:MAG TPA: class I SAM-dependent methyltransferase, partial [Actinomycetota bacterium]|nr:class I SAM-dependent methyltransferase [Actinomycetota bacterium]
GLDTIARLVTQPSSLALPQLVAEGLTADAAFVDGSHRFHEVFVDLYFLGKIVRPGGIIVLDDHHWPSVRTAAHYFEVNLGWRELPGAFAGGTVDPATGHPRLRALRLPDSRLEPGFERFRPF